MCRYDGIVGIKGRGGEGRKREGRRRGVEGEGGEFDQEKLVMKSSILHLAENTVFTIPELNSFGSHILPLEAFVMRSPKDWPRVKASKDDIVRC